MSRAASRAHTANRHQKVSALGGPTKVCSREFDVLVSRHPPTGGTGLPKDMLAVFAEESRTDYLAGVGTWPIARATAAAYAANLEALEVGQIGYQQRLRHSRSRALVFVHRDLAFSRSLGRHQMLQSGDNAAHPDVRRLTQPPVRTRQASAAQATEAMLHGEQSWSGRVCRLDDTPRLHEPIG